MTKPIRILLFGAGNRGASVYGRYGLEHPEEVRFVAVAEPNPVRREKFASDHKIPTKRQFTTWREALEAEKLADAVLNATQDEMHHASALAAIDAGYAMLLEKPIAPSLAATLDIVRAAEKSGQLLMICHVLRYTEFFQKMHEIINSGRLGQVVHISHSENVSYYHMAHSYVRGNWRNSSQSAPMILAKCCHDLDLLYWVLGEKPSQLSSTGNLRHFIEANAPQGAPPRCTDGCPSAKTCPFYAPRIYIQSLPIKAAVARSPKPLIQLVGKLALHHPRTARLLGSVLPPVKTLAEYSGWPRSTITEYPESDEAVFQALQDGAYGRCVYHCDNDVVDHQLVSLAFPSGITASLTMHGHSHEESRTMRVDGSKATLLGKFAFSQAWLEVRPHFPGAKVERFAFSTEVDQTSGHGGGDAGLMRRFVKALRGEQSPLTGARDSLESHLMAFAAEESRLMGKTIDMDAYRHKAI
jgi:predicted dehydrogenase